jgi:hypothetical protein
MTLALLLASAIAACGGVDRKYADVDASGGRGGTGGSADAGRKDAGPDAKGGSTMDSGVADVETDVDDSGPPPPPPPPGRPGFAVVAGGVHMKSSSYSAIVVSGEAPGYNGTVASPNFKLQGGVVGTTQP